MSATSSRSDATVRPRSRRRRRRRRLDGGGALRRGVRRRGVVDEGNAQGVVVPGVGVRRELQIVIAAAAAAVPAPWSLLGVQDVLRVVH